MRLLQKIFSGDDPARRRTRHMGSGCEPSPLNKEGARRRARRFRCRNVRVCVTGDGDYPRVTRRAGEVVAGVAPHRQKHPERAGRFLAGALGLPRQLRLQDHFENSAPIQSQSYLSIRARCLDPPRSPPGRRQCREGRRHQTACSKRATSGCSSEEVPKRIGSCTLRMAAAPTCL